MRKAISYESFTTNHPTFIFSCRRYQSKASRNPVRPPNQYPRSHEIREDYISSTERCLPGLVEVDPVTAPLKCPLPGHKTHKNDYTHIWERPLPVPNEVQIVSDHVNTNGVGSVSY